MKLKKLALFTAISLALTDGMWIGPPKTGVFLCLPTA
ncbi:Uncharacterised protein [Vibrio cholerae]|nr:Uncharacterised protein [Vibrio cholerae]